MRCIADVMLRLCELCSKQASLMSSLGSKHAGTLKSLSRANSSLAHTQSRIGTATLGNPETAALGQTMPEPPGTAPAVKESQQTSAGPSVLGDMQTIRGYMELLDEYSLHHFMLWRGQVCVCTLRRSVSAAVLTNRMRHSLVAVYHSSTLTAMSDLACDAGN